MSRPTAPVAVATATVGRYTVTVTEQADRFGYHDVSTFCEDEQTGDVCATPMRDETPQEYADRYAAALAEARG